MHVMKYTRRSLNTLVLMLTTFIFILIYLIFIYFFQLFNIPKKEVYSQSIPIIYNNDKTEDYFYNPYRISENLKYFTEDNNIKEEKYMSDKEKQENKKQENKVVSKYESEIRKIQKEDINKSEREIVTENKGNGWRIKIPKINLDAHISEGIEQKILLKSIGHFKDSSKWEGNVCLAAHNRGYNCNFFRDIEKLKQGDEITYSIDGKEKTYKVVFNKIIDETDWRDLDSSKKDCITLITCVENRREYRRCVQGYAVNEKL